MQKINRKELKAALSVYNKDGFAGDIVFKAAALLLEITGEDYEPSEEMICAAFEQCDGYNAKYYKDLFKAMIQELAE